MLFKMNYSISSKQICEFCNFYFTTIFKALHLKKFIFSDYLKKDL